MKTIPFDIKYKKEIEEGYFIPLLEVCGCKAKILSWDEGGDYPIVVIPDKEGGLPYRVSNTGKANPEYSDIVLARIMPEKDELQAAAEKFVEEHNAAFIQDFMEEAFTAGAIWMKGRNKRQLSRLSEAVLMDWPCKVDIAKEVASEIY